MTWDVTLNNDAAIFDYRGGFETLREAIEWSLGRGYNYNIQIGADSAHTLMHMCVSRGKLMYDYYGEWVAVDVDEFCKRYERS